MSFLLYVVLLVKIVIVLQQVYYLANTECFAFFPLIFSFIIDPLCVGSNELKNF